MDGTDGASERPERALDPRLVETGVELALIAAAKDVLLPMARKRGGLAFPATDDGLVQRFLAVWRTEVLWVSDGKAAAFWVWHEDRWIEDRTNQVPARVRALARAVDAECRLVAPPPRVGDPLEDRQSRQRRERIERWRDACQSVARHKAVLELLHARVGFDLRMFDDEATDDLLNTPTSLLDIRRGRLLGVPDPARHITRVTGVPWWPDADCPAFRDAVLGWMCGRQHLADYLQKLLGASLLPGLATRHLVVLHGASGANGKSTLSRIVRAVLGDYAATLSVDALISHGRTSASAHAEVLSPLVGARCVLASEGSEQMRWNLAAVKLLSGGDLVSMRGIFGRQRELRPTWTMFLATNVVPDVSGVDGALRDRLRLIPFDRRLPTDEQDPDLARRLVATEGSGILNWTLEGLARALTDGLDDVPAEVRVATDDYLDAADDLGRYLEARTVPDPKSRVGASELYHDYARWCAQEGLEPVTSTRFGLRLTGRGIAKGTTTRNTIVRIGVAFSTDDAAMADLSFEEDPS